MEIWWLPIVQHFLLHTKIRLLLSTWSSDGYSPGMLDDSCEDEEEPIQHQTNPTVSPDILKAVSCSTDHHTPNPQGHFSPKPNFNDHKDSPPHQAKESQVARAEGTNQLRWSTANIDASYITMITPQTSNILTYVVFLSNGPYVCRWRWDSCQLMKWILSVPDVKDNRNSKKFY